MATGRQVRRERRNVKTVVALLVAHLYVAVWVTLALVVYLAFVK